VRTAEVTAPRVFQLLEAVTLPVGTTLSAIGTVEDSSPDTDAFTSDGTPDQSFVLTSTPYLDDSLTWDWGGEAYTQVDNFLSSTATSKHFTVWVDQNDRARVTFGNGVNGKIPGKDVTGTATYKTGGGSAGIVEASAICKLDGSFVDTLGNGVVISVDNDAASSGGEDRESVESMRQLIPASTRVPFGCITREDFELAARLVPGVVRALALSHGEYAGIPENTVWLYPIPAGGGAPTDAVKDAVETMVTVTRPAPTSMRVDIVDPVYLPIAVHAKIWLKPGFTPATVAAAIRAALVAWFRPDVAADNTPNLNVDFGYNIQDEDGDPAGLVALSDIFNVVRDISGVLRVGSADADFTLNSVHDDVAIAVMQFPSIGAVTIVNGATGGSL